MKPILKWAGGKSQLLPDLLPRIPKTFGKYIEPFFGGGALFFALQPDNAVIADSNPEIINVYLQLAHHVDEVIERLKLYKNEEEVFYQARSLDWKSLSEIDAAARTLFLNKTCFNGLYRVNKEGFFNTPFGRYKNPKICDEDHLRSVSEALKKATIVCGDFWDVLERYAEKGDFIFLDPPYVPVSEYADFKRYTKEQFREADQRRLAETIDDLYAKGCYVLLTNSNAPLVHELYDKYPFAVVQTKRAINSKGNGRTGEDVIVTAYPRLFDATSEAQADKQMKMYPPTRFMGSKNKLLPEIWGVSSRFQFNSVLDLFSGSGVVSYMYKVHGKKVFSNDYMSMCCTFSKAMIENSHSTLSEQEIEWLLTDHGHDDHFVSETFSGLYFTDEENVLIDVIRANIKAMDDENKRSVAMAALIRACTKKRPRGLFTYVGTPESQNDGRRDLRISLRQQFVENACAVNEAVFDNGTECISIQGDALQVEGVAPDLVYMDPPYYSKLSDNEYVRRYHFIEGLARDWDGVEIQQHTKTKKFKSYPTPFSSREGATTAFDYLFEKYKGSIIVVSYSSNSLPTKEEIIDIMKKYKRCVEVIPVNYTYGFGNQRTAKTHRNNVQEYLFVGC